MTENNQQERCPTCGGRSYQRRVNQDTAWCSDPFHSPQPVEQRRAVASGLRQSADRAASALTTANRQIEELKRERDEAFRKVSESGAKLAERGGRAVPIDGKTHYEESLEAQLDTLREAALEAQGALEPVIGLLRLKGEIGASQIPKLERAHDYIKRIVDGENWRERWAAVQAGKPDPGRLSSSTEGK